MSTIYNTDTMTEHLNTNNLEEGKYKQKTVFKKYRECFCPSVFNCIYKISILCMYFATTSYLIFGILYIYIIIYIKYIMYIIIRAIFHI